MKLKKLLTGFVAAAVAVSTMAISSFAATVTLDDSYKGDWSMAGIVNRDSFQEFIDMFWTDGEYPYIKVTVSVEPTNVADTSPYIFKPLVADSWGVISGITSDTATVKPDGFMQVRKDQTQVEFVLPNTFLNENYNGQLGFQVCNVIIKGVELSLADGPEAAMTIITDAETIQYCNYLEQFAPADAEEEATEEEATEEVEEEAAEEVEEEATEEVEEEAAEEVEEEAAEEEVEEEAAEEEVDDDAALEPDWDAYDADAMAAMNEEFVLGGNIDIYSVVGDDWADIATIEADFVWTPGLGGWCGGAGIGNGAVAADGSTWISGPEYGAANANSKYEPDGKATQVLVDLSANPLTAIASVGDDGETVFAQLMVQNWWNGVEAGAQVAAVRFLDADGNVIGELTYDVEAPVVEEVEEEVEEDEAPATGDVDASTDSSKGSPDTGVEDVAVVAGLAIVAAGAVLVSKKRK